MAPNVTYERVMELAVFWNEFLPIKKTWAAFSIFSDGAVCIVSELPSLVLLTLCPGILTHHQCSTFYSNLETAYFTERRSFFTSFTL